MSLCCRTSFECLCKIATRYIISLFILSHRTIFLEHLMIVSESSQGKSLMGSVCSCKRDHYADENITRRGFSGRYFKFGSSKWLESSLFLPDACCQFQQSSCPSLMELCVCKICEVTKYLHPFEVHGWVLCVCSGSLMLSVLTGHWQISFIFNAPKGHKPVDIQPSGGFMQPFW